MLSPEAKSADFWGLLLVYLARLQPQATKQSTLFLKFSLNNMIIITTNTLNYILKLY